MTIGILGGGQLAMMLGEAGRKLGMEFRFLDPAESPPAKGIGVQIRSAYDQEEGLLELTQGTDLVTFEFENVPARSAELIADRAPVFPPAAALATAQDRLAEKTLFESLGIPTPTFSRVDSIDDLGFAIQDIGLPAVLKTRTMGYDGKGQAVLREAGDLAPAFERLKGFPLIVERFIPFERELSLIAVRSKNGETAFYPLIQNHHEGGILRVSRAPAAVSPSLQQKAESYGRALLEHFGYVGVLTIEFCEVQGELMAIEMAPRVHNSGHLTIEAAETSQFENHLRAIAGLPLGSTRIPRPAAMVNLIGSVPDLSRWEHEEGVAIHLYGKEPRPGRKLGHVTIIGESKDIVEATVASVEAGLEPSS